MTLYVDVLFAINFSMDFLSLFFTAKLLHKNTAKARILIASLIGGLYGIIDVLVQFPPVIKAIICVLVPFLMCTLALFEKNIKRLIVSFLMYWATSFVLGGIMSVLYSFANKVFAEYLSNSTSEVTYNGVRFFIVVSLTVIFMLIFGKVFVSKKDLKSASVEVLYEGKSYRFDGLCDSGNIVTDPLSGRAVLLIGMKNELGKIIESKDEMQKRFIPYSDVTSKGILKGIIPEKIKVNNNEVDAIIAPIDKEKFGDYEALIPASLL